MEDRGVKPVSTRKGLPTAHARILTLLPVAAWALLSGPLSAQEARALLDRASAAMGADGLNTIRIVDEGAGYTFGQAFIPGMPWPKITVHRRVRTINYVSGSFREELTLSRAEPKGGGGYPVSGQQKNEQYFSGSFAWNQTGTGPAASPRFAVERMHQLWITPHGVIKAALRNAGSLKLEGGPGNALAFTEPGRFMATAFLSADHLVERVESRFPDPVLGEVEAVTRYSDYRDFGGVQFPTRIQQSLGGHPVLDVAVLEVEPNASAEIQVPDPVRAAVEKVTIDKVAEGVWFVSGGSHNSVAIAMRDHLILVESPLNDGRTGPVLEQVRQLAPGKPIRYLINSHHHFDHSGGVRTAVAAGATIVTQAGNVAYLKRALAVPNRIAPDQLAQSGRKATFKQVKDKLVLADRERRVEIHRIQGNLHNDTFLMVYLPAEKLLIEADAYTPLPPNAPPPSPPNPNTVNLVDNLERLNLSVDRILPLHGPIVPVGALYAAIGRTAP